MAIIHVAIGNIPAKYHSKDLRNFFSSIVETDGFDCFHFRHRPEVKRLASRKPMPPGHKSLLSCCCIIRVSEDRYSELSQYNERHWLNEKNESMKSQCHIRKIGPFNESEDAMPYKTRKEKTKVPEDREEFTKSDLDNLIELHPPNVMPKGNVGTPTRVFLELINQCKLPPSIISKLQLKFPKVSYNNIYGRVPCDYPVPCLPNSQEHFERLSSKDRPCLGSKNSMKNLKNDGQRLISETESEMLIQNNLNSTDTTTTTDNTTTDNTITITTTDTTTTDTTTTDTTTTDHTTTSTDTTTTDTTTTTDNTTDTTTTTPEVYNIDSGSSSSSSSSSSNQNMQTNVTINDSDDGSSKTSTVNNEESCHNETSSTKSEKSSSDDIQRQRLHSDTQVDFGKLRKRNIEETSLKSNDALERKRQRMKEKAKRKQNKAEMKRKKALNIEEKMIAFERGSDNSEDDADYCEEWERHEALYDDPTGQERSKERLFEQDLEVKWEKGGSGLVFYTDAQYWQEQEGDFDEQTADDWDVDMRGYYDPGCEDMDARDFIAMRRESRLAEGRENDDGVSFKIGKFERHTKGFGRKIMEQLGWKDGKGLGATSSGIAEALGNVGKKPSNKSGIGFHKSQISKKQWYRKNRNNSDGDVAFISTIYDNPSTTDPEDSLLRRNEPYQLKRRK
ncbi:G patch domain-containing protein 3-like [Argonauta hians]